MKNPRIAVNLSEIDHALVAKLQEKIAHRLGFPVPITNVVRMGLAALAKKEKLV